MCGQTSSSMVRRLASRFPSRLEEICLKGRELNAIGSEKAQPREEARRRLLVSRKTMVPHASVDHSTDNLAFDALKMGSPPSKSGKLEMRCGS